MVDDARAVAGGGASFDAFFRAEHRRLAALATAMCGDRETGRDVAQEALARTYEEWDRVGAMERPGAWTRRVVVNLVRDHGRHLAVRRRRLPELARQLDRGPSPDVAALDAETWAAVAALPERQRIAIAIFYIGDRSVRDVAEAMGVHEGTVKTTLHAARERLRRELSGGSG
ncbi:RNA polymerase sigma factor [Ilumatobacter sp.]|uniref:RNA polymerase sigma factor n=1 Tax=Ilumatobacter sp. TaxID=1967498 RepID=UPI003B523A3E